VGRRFTWCNERELATHTRIDRVLVTKDWELAFPHFQLTLASTNVSDHCPIALKPMVNIPFRSFIFQSHWLKDDQFKVVVSSAWNKHVQSTDPVRVLHTKLSRTEKALKRWNKEKVRWTIFASNVASEVIFNLDLAQEERQLTNEERSLRADLKNKLLQLTKANGDRNLDSLG
jgi:hypothetical protein